jgi:hypothetical protein
MGKGETAMSATQIIEGCNDNAMNDKHTVKQAVTNYSNHYYLLKLFQVF